VTDPDERRRLMAESCDAFVKNSLPQLARLGLVEIT
jgi:hypothetical protein